jgi:peptide/nickel transport system permease protein
VLRVARSADSLPLAHAAAGAVRRHGALGRLVRGYPLGAFGAGVLLVMTLAALCAPWLAPYDPLATDYAKVIRPPSVEHWLGTDHFGRDVLSRLIFGARTALLVGLVSSVVSATLGSLVGAATAYFGGMTDLLVQRLTDILLSFPLIILAIAVVAVLGAGTGQVIAAIIVPMVPRATRVVRASALAVRQMPYVEAAHSLGMGPLRVIGRHLLPNVAAPYLIILTAFLAEVIVLEASLSFLGLGVVEPTPAWGLMLRDFAGHYAEAAPWLPLSPGLAICLGVFGFNLLGDAVRDALDPRLRGRLRT